MPNLSIEVETPSSFCDIDFAKMAVHYGDPIDVITGLEGTVTPWGFGTRHSAIGADVMETLTEGIDNEYVVGAHSITNRAGSAGKFLTSLFTDTIREAGSSVISLGEYPQSRAERKPSGIMSNRLFSRLAKDEEIWKDPRRRVANSVIVAFVGDKLSDMLEAEKLHDVYDGWHVEVVGFMVNRYGNADHPLDTAFGKRRSATKARLELQAAAQNRFLR